MNKNRLNEIESHLELLYEQRREKEEAIIVAARGDKTILKQQLRLEILKPIRDYEQEYWQIIAGQSNLVQISEADAEVVIAEFVEGVGQLREENAEVIEYLQKILAKVEEPGPTAAAKLKAVVSSIPPFVGISYEAELDTENFLNRYFPTFMKAVQRLKK
jgi:ABC-type Fe2+-enterobactin transport system substrate-binding protein